jgi:hypothetical protein
MIDRQKFIKELGELRYRYEKTAGGRGKGFSCKSLVSQIRKVARTVDIKLTDEEIRQIDFEAMDAITDHQGGLNVS